MKKIGLLLGPLVFIILLLIPPVSSLTPDAWKVLALAIFMLIWWVSEAVPIAVTALLPMVLLPLLQIYEMKTAAAPYAHPLVFLFMGGFMLALAMEKWNLHQRIALNIVNTTGTNANGIILGFMLATAFLSMWISNTATTVMMLPIAVSVIALLSKNNQDTDKHRTFSISLMLGLAYAANIGGTATLVGTPPNVVFGAYISKTYDIQIDFATWMFFALPFALVLLFITYFVLTRVLFPNRLGEFEGASTLIRTQLHKMGHIQTPEIRTLIVFILTALSWILKKQINLLFALDKKQGDIELSDTGIALLATIALFVIPTGKGKQRQALLDWQDTQRLPWGILLLFGGGLSLAAALKHVGIIDMIGDYFSHLNTSSFLITLGLTAVALFLTEIMSNVAMVTVLLPVIGAVGIGLGLDPVLLCIPVTLAASCAFMLPMSTPPNAIVFASGKLNIPHMVRAGLWLNIIAILLITFLTHWVLPIILN